jgi:hypothetical protein
MVMIADPLAGGEPLEEGAVEAARRVKIDVFDDGGLSQLCRAQSAGEALVLAAGRFAIDQEAEPILAGQFGGLGRVLHLDKGVGHGREAERAQALDRGMDQHLLSFQCLCQW